MEKTLKSRLHEIQLNLKAPKNQRNTFGNYNYRNCEDILNAVKPLLMDGEVVLLSDDLINVSNRYYVKAVACFCCGADEVKVSAFAREAETKKGMDEAQITGSASSYARKYALNGLFAIDDTKDADSTNDHGKGEETAKPTPSARPTTSAKPEPRKAMPLNVKVNGTIKKVEEKFSSQNKPYYVVNFIETATGEELMASTLDRKIADKAAIAKGDQEISFVVKGKYKNLVDVVEALPFA